MNISLLPEFLFLLMLLLIISGIYTIINIYWREKELEELEGDSE